MAVQLREFTGWADCQEMMRLVERNPANSVYFKRHPWQTTHFVKSLAATMPEPPLPPGFSLRPVANAGEYVKIHRAAFESTAMTTGWLERVEKWPNYRPELNVVAVAPGETVVAFCSGWLGRVDPAKISGTDDVGLAGQIEPVGVHPNYRGKKLGRAVLETVFRRMKAEGVNMVIV